MRKKNKIPSGNPFRNIVFLLFAGVFIATAGCSNFINPPTPPALPTPETPAAAKTVETATPFLAASVEFNPALNELDKNIDRLAEEVEKALQKGARLVVTPEMATTGYQYPSRAAIRPYVDTIPGVTTDRFGKLAKQYNAYIAVGMAEQDADTDIFYNSAFLVGPDGYIGKYRKLHLWEAEEHWAAWGDTGVPVFDTDLGRMAINICMDAAYYESARLAALGGADILLFLTNSSAQAVAALPARAQQNGMYIVSANRSDTELDFHMIGLSAIWSPMGRKLAESPYSGKDTKTVADTVIIYAEIDPARYQNRNRANLDERQPELYKDLMLKIAPWDYTKNTTSHDVTAAALQYEPVIGDKDANLANIETLITNAKTKNPALSLVVLPELSVTGPVSRLPVSLITTLAEPAGGSTFSTMARLAKQNGVAIVYGFVEKAANGLYNTAVLLDAKGNQAGKYQKTHLSAADKIWAQPGRAIEVFSAENLGNVGLLIGEDVCFPEAAGVLTVKRADIICIPSAWNGQYSGYMEIHPKVSGNRYPEGSVVLWDAVAMGSEAYTLVANYVGTDRMFLGRSSLFTLDPLYQLDQPVVAGEMAEETLVVKFTTLQNDWWVNQEMLISSRRTDYYMDLVRELTVH